MPVPSHGVAQRNRLGAEPGVSIALVRNLNFHNFTEIGGDKTQAGLRNVTHMEWQLDVTHRGISEQVSA